MLRAPVPQPLFANEDLAAARMTRLQVLAAPIEWTIDSFPPILPIVKALPPAALSSSTSLTSCFGLLRCDKS